MQFPEQTTIQHQIYMPFSLQTQSCLGCYDSFARCSRPQTVSEQTHCHQSPPASLDEQNIVHGYWIAVQLDPLSNGQPQFTQNNNASNNKNNNNKQQSKLALAWCFRTFFFIFSSWSNAITRLCAVPRNVSLTVKTSMAPERRQSNLQSSRLCVSHLVPYTSFVAFLGCLSETGIWNNDQVLWSLARPTFVGCNCMIVTRKITSPEYFFSLAVDVQVLVFSSTFLWIRVQYWNQSPRSDGFQERTFTVSSFYAKAGPVWERYW